MDLRGNNIDNATIKRITSSLKSNIDMRQILHDHEKGEKTAEGESIREAMIYELKLNFFCDVFITPKARELVLISSGDTNLLRVDLTDEPNLNLEALCKFL